jgi:hypothetical protein
MTEPTQAQIEAAANAMIDCMFAPHELPLEGELWCKYLETAKAALTAAAGMGPTMAEITTRRFEEMKEQLGEQELEIDRLTAAAGVVQLPIDNGQARLEGYIAERIALARLDMKERCALKIEEIGRDCWPDRLEPEHAAAAIRALKDKP